MNKLREKFNEAIGSLPVMHIPFSDGTYWQYIPKDMVIYGKNVREEFINKLIEAVCDIRGCDNPLMPYDEDEPEPKILGPCRYCGKEK